jgi:hypothetical protein
MNNCDVNNQNRIENTNKIIDNCFVSTASVFTPVFFVMTLLEKNPHSTAIFANPSQGVSHKIPLN